MIYLQRFTCTKDLEISFFDFSAGFNKHIKSPFTSSAQEIPYGANQHRPQSDLIELQQVKKISVKSSCLANLSKRKRENWLVSLSAPMLHAFCHLYVLS